MLYLAGGAVVLMATMVCYLPSLINHCHNVCAAAATCPSINVANSNKKIDGTGTSTTTGGIVPFVCDPGYSGSGDAVCTANEEDATLAAFKHTPCEGALSGNAVL